MPVLLIFSYPALRTENLKETGSFLLPNDIGKSGHEICDGEQKEFLSLSVYPLAPLVGLNRLQLQHRSTTTIEEAKKGAPKGDFRDV